MAEALNIINEYSFLRNNKYYKKELRKYMDSKKELFRKKNENYTTTEKFDNLPEKEYLLIYKKIFDNLEKINEKIKNIKSKKNKLIFVKETLSICIELLKHLLEGTENLYIEIIKNLQYHYTPSKFRKKTHIARKKAIIKFVESCNNLIKEINKTGLDVLDKELDEAYFAALTLDENMDRKTINRLKNYVITIEKIEIDTKKNLSDIKSFINNTRKIIEKMPKYLKKENNRLNKEIRRLSPNHNLIHIPEPSNNAELSYLINYKELVIKFLKFLRTERLDNNFKIVFTQVINESKGVNINNILKQSGLIINPEYILEEEVEHEKIPLNIKKINENLRLLDGHQETINNFREELNNRGEINREELKNIIRQKSFINLKNAFNNNKKIRTIKKCLKGNADIADSYIISFAQKYSDSNIRVLAKDKELIERLNNIGFIKNTIKKFQGVNAQISNYEGEDNKIVLYDSNYIIEKVNKRSPVLKDNWK